MQLPLSTHALTERLNRPKGRAFRVRARAVGMEHFVTVFMFSSPFKQSTARARRESDHVRAHVTSGVDLAFAGWRMICAGKRGQRIAFPPPLKHLQEHEPSAGGCVPDMVCAGKTTFSLALALTLNNGLIHEMASQ
jgi:hypothetical protein